MMIELVLLLIACVYMCQSVCARVHECVSVCVCYIQERVCYGCCISESQFFQQLLAGLILTERLC